MALDFPNAPTNGQIYTVTGTGEQWVYEAATNSWTSKGLVNTTGGLQYKGDADITAVPPTSATSGSQYSVNPGGTANAGFGPGVTGTVAKGSMVMYTGTGWVETSHAVPEATPLVKGIDTRKWNRTGTVLSPATAGDQVHTATGNLTVGGTLPSAPNINLKADGSAAFTGAVGIGTATPKYKLEVKGGRIGVNTTAGTAASVVFDQVGTGVAEIGMPASQNALAFKVWSGAALVERVRLTSGGVLLVGTSSVSTGTSIGVQGNPGSSAGEAVVRLNRGTANPTTNQTLGAVVFGQSSGNEGAYILGEADAAWGTGNYPGRLTFYTTAVGANGPTERMRISQDSTIGFGNTVVAPAAPVFKMTLKASGILNLANVPIYADIAAAQAGGLVAGDVFRNTASMLVIVS